MLILMHLFESGNQRPKGDRAVEPVSELIKAKFDGVGMCLEVESRRRMWDLAR